MSLLPKAILRAAAIDEINSQTISFLQAQAQRAYDLVNADGDQQATLDALGSNAVEAITVYATIHGALASIGKVGSLPTPDYSIYVPNPDGTVTYVAPPEPPAPDEQP